MIYLGGCHCGAVRFELELAEKITVYECNCSICRKAGYVHLIVPRSKLRILQGEDSISIYTFNTGVAKHTFCKICGIKPFYIPRSNPDGYSVNLRCLDEKPPIVNIEPFDGRNWENAEAIDHLSRED